MLDKRKFYIDGQWVDPVAANDLHVINPATEQPVAVISMGSPADVDKAVAAAKRAFESWSQTTPEERMALLERLLARDRTIGLQIERGRRLALRVECAGGIAAIVDEREAGMRNANLKCRAGFGADEVVTADLHVEHGVVDETVSRRRAGLA